MSERSRLSLPVVAGGASPDAPACRDAAEPHPDEFAKGSSIWDERLSRRNFLSITATSSIAMLAGTGCSDRPTEPIVPYVDPPEQVLAGESQFFATTLARQGYGRGVIVTTREGRPVKIEGNPDHPASLGAADAQMQAAVLDLYDPLRSRTVTEAGVTRTWGDFVRALREQIASHSADGGARLAILTGTVTSPTVARLMEEVNKSSPNATWHAYEPLGHGSATASIYDLSVADVIVSFDNDFLSALPGSLAYARQFADRRRPSAVRPSMSRLYVAESDVSLTGMKADHRVAVRPGRLLTLQAALASQLGLSPTPMPRDLSRAEAAWLSAVATDLAAARGRGLVMSDNDTGLAMSINEHLSNVGKTVTYVDSAVRSPPTDYRDHSLAELIDKMHSGQARTLLIAADNPARTAPVDLAFAKSLEDLTRSGGFTAHLGLYANETAYASRWHLPAQHDLERWGDVAAFDGTPSVVQPLITPLHNGHDIIEMLNVVIGRETSAYDTVRTTWQAARAESGPAFETWWSNALRTGAMEKPAAKNVAFVFASRGEAWTPASASTHGIDVVLRPDPAIGDGSQFHNPWLQELPRPLTKIVWGNAGLLSPATAERLNVRDGDVMSVEKDGRRLDVPIVVVPGVADDTMVLHLGYGEHRIVGADAAWSAGNVPRGVDAYALRTSASPTVVAGAKLTPTGRRVDVVRTHNHHAIAAAGAGEAALTPRVVATPQTLHDELALHNRKLIRTATLGEFFREPDFAAKMDEGEIHQLYPSWDYNRGPQWGMTIDLTACIGCNACITACQAENNTPSVGPEQVAKQREMHWLRVDTYLDDDGRAHHQPVACMHCENAPCEYVCPVAATTHSVDGLNQMTYNRCVGTRYCSNNCPYKVRRFNFLNYTAGTPESYAMQRNPDVTVRTRGVMEKCTYCVQRLVYADRKAEIAALDAGDQADAVRREAFGRVQTACQQTCPTRAIHFGDLTDLGGEVAQSKQSPLNYGLLTELSTKPRTTYLASITNPSPSMESAS